MYLYFIPFDYWIVFPFYRYMLWILAFVLLGLVIFTLAHTEVFNLFFLNKSLDPKSVRYLLMNIDFVHLHFRVGNLVLKYLENLGCSRIFLIVCFFFQRGCDSYMVYLFDKSKTVYEGPFASRSLSDCVNYIGKSSSFIDWALNLK